MQIFQELQRRNVFRVAIGYIVSSWLLVQVADLVLENIGSPDWVMQTIMLVLALGFPVVVFFSWAYEVTPEGIKRESEIDRSQSVTHITSRKLDRAIVVVLVIALAYFAYDKFVLGPEKIAELVEGMQQVGDEPAQVEPEATTEPNNSIAVLPFLNMSNNQENEYFADGLTEILLNQLAQVADLKVAARTSSFAFKGAQVDIREIGEKLDVANVLEGSVQRSGDRVRITAQLIQTSDGYHLWSQTFDRDLDNIFAVQDEIAAQVSNALTGSLLNAGAGEPSRNGGTRNTEAYDLYLQGRKAFHANTERQANESERLMRRAISLDPDFALAWAGLAQALRRYATLAGLAAAEYRDEYRSVAEKAAELAPDNSQVLSVLGEMLLNFGEMGQAQDVLERAIGLDPSNASAWSRLADVHFIQGRYRDAAKAATRAMSVDPLDFDLKAQSTYKFTQRGQLEKAEMLAQAVLDNDPQSTAGLAALGNLYWRTGRFAEAYRVYHRMLELNPDILYIMGRLAVSFIELEDWGTARGILQKIEATNPKFVTGSFNGEVSSWLCYITNDMECVRSVLNQRIAMADSEQERIEFTVGLARYEENWEAMLQGALAGIESAADRDDLWGQGWNRQLAALAADRLGRLELRDDMIELSMSYLLDGKAQGSDAQYGYFLQSYLHALRGDAAKAVPELQAAIDRGYRDVPAIFHLGYFDAILEEPQVRALLEQLRADNARELKQLRTVVDELGPFW